MSAAPWGKHWALSVSKLLLLDWSFLFPLSPPSTATVTCPCPIRQFGCTRYDHAKTARSPSRMLKFQSHSACHVNISRLGENPWEGFCPFNSFIDSVISLPTPLNFIDLPFTCQKTSKVPHYCFPHRNAAQPDELVQPCINAPTIQENLSSQSPSGF
jgi:hypothetical protein